MTKAERLLAILTYLRGRHRAVSARQLADHLDVSLRTIYRDIQSLMLQGADIQGEAGVGYRLSDRGELPPLTFTVAELEALTFGARLVKACADPELTQAANQALNKVRSVLPARRQYEIEQRRAPMLVATHIDSHLSQFAAELRDAIARKVQVVFGYRDEKGQNTQRTVQPLGLVYWGYCWHLVSWCLLRNDYRVFRLERLRQLTVTDASFCQPDVSIQQYLARYAPDAQVDFWSI